VSGGIVPDIYIRAPSMVLYHSRCSHSWCLCRHCVWLTWHEVSAPLSFVRKVFSSPAASFAMTARVQPWRDKEKRYYPIDQQLTVSYWIDPFFHQTPIRMDQNRYSRCLCWPLLNSHLRRSVLIIRLACVAISLPAEHTLLTVTYLCFPQDADKIRVLSSY